ncbi:MAG: hypothetical protein IKB38_05420 [Clostridia bacterium]|nr:hypothetical protein [Clostridia bacterium]
MMKIKTAAALFLCCLVIGVTPVFASACFGSGCGVIAADVSLVKTAVRGEKICFRDTDFKCALGITDFKSITLVSVPKESDGILIYAGRRATVGQTVKRRTVPSLVFIPASEKVKEARFSFSAEGFADGEVIECVMKFKKSHSEAPSALLTTAAPESEESSVFKGKLRAKDPEGDAIEYFIAAYPKLGAISVSKDGEYVYTPSSDFKGKDSFSWVARDEWGNWSEVVRVKISSEK